MGCAMSSMPCAVAAAIGRRSWSASTQWYEPVLEAKYDDARVRAADITTLVRIGANYASRESFLTDLTLDPPNATSDESGPPHRDDDFVILSTIHSAKGQEWKNVFVLNAVDGCIPSDLGTGSTAETRRRTALALRRHDARQGQSAHRCAATLLRHATSQER